MVQKGGANGRPTLKITSEDEPVSGEPYCVTVSGPPGAVVQVEIQITDEQGGNSVTVTEVGTLPDPICFGAVPPGYSGGTATIQAFHSPKPPTNAPGSIPLTLDIL